MFLPLVCHRFASPPPRQASHGPGTVLTVVGSSKNKMVTLPSYDVVNIRDLPATLLSYHPRTIVLVLRFRVLSVRA